MLIFLRRDAAARCCKLWLHRGLFTDRLYCLTPLSPPLSLPSYFLCSSSHLFIVISVSGFFNSRRRMSFCHVLTPSQMAKLLLEQPGINLELTDSEGNTPLHLAAFFNEYEVHVNTESVSFSLVYFSFYLSQFPSSIRPHALCILFFYLLRHLCMFHAMTRQGPVTPHCSSHPRIPAFPHP